nr:hypothetical protein CFP56_59830 [Quercus suber]
MDQLELPVPTPVTIPTSQPSLNLYHQKLPKTTASTTKALILASTASTCAEVMFLMKPAKAVSALRHKKSEIGVHLVRLPSYGTMSAR